MSEIRTEISFPLRDDERKKALAALEEIRKAQAINAQAAISDSKKYDELTKKNADLEKQYSKLVKAYKQADSAFKNQETQLRDNTKAALDNAKALDELAKKEEKAAQEAEQLRRQQLEKAGQGAGAISQVGGAISQIPGLGGIGSAASGGTAIFDLLENVPKLTETFKGLPQIIQATAQSSGGLVSGLASGLTPALGATGASIAALTAVALPLIAAGAALAAGLALLQKHTEEVTEATREAANARQTEADTQRDFTQLLNSGDVEGALAERERLFLDSANLARDVARENAVLQEKQLALAQDVAAGGTGIFSGTRAAFDEQKKIVDDLIASSAQANIALTAADQALAGVSQQSITAASNAESLAQVQEELNRTTQEYEQTLKSQDQVLNQIRQLENQANEVRANYAEQNADRAEDEALASKQALETQALDEQFANEDRLAQNQEFQDSLLAIEQQGQDKIKSLRADLGSLADERIKAISDAENKGNADIAKLQKEFMSDSLKTVQKFQESEKRVQQRGQIERLRLLQDLNDSLADAQRDNNVIAFLEAQRNGEKQLQRDAQDAGLEAKQRADDFARENEERRNALNQRIADIQANIDKEREQINQQYAERQATIEKSIADEEAAIQERTRAAIAANNEQAANEARNAERVLLRENLKAQQQEQRDAVVEARRNREHQDQLARIDQQAQAQQRALQNITSQLAALQTQAASQRSNISSLSGVGGTASTGFHYSIGNHYGTNQVRAFAEGGIATSPTLGLLGERSGYGDLVLPFKKSDGLPVGARGMSGGRGAINLNYSPIFQSTIGDIVSSSEVSEALREFALQHGQAQVAMLEKWLNP